MELFVSICGADSPGYTVQCLCLCLRAVLVSTGFDTEVEGEV